MIYICKMIRILESSINQSNINVFWLIAYLEKLTTINYFCEIPGSYVFSKWPSNKEIFKKIAAVCLLVFIYQFKSLKSRFWLQNPASFLLVVIWQYLDASFMPCKILLSLLIPQNEKSIGIWPILSHLQPRIHKWQRRVKLIIGHWKMKTNDFLSPLRYLPLAKIFQKGPRNYCGIQH